MFSHDRFPAESRASEQPLVSGSSRVSERRAELTPCVVDAGSLRRLVNENADGILVVDREGRVRFVNPAAQELFGRPARELLDSPFGLPIVSGEFAEIDIVRPDGSIRTAELRAVQTNWGGGPGQIVSLRDVTERRSLETQLRQSQKMEALGRLAGGISHDFNNMLTSILCECSVLAEQIDPSDPRRRGVEQIANTAQNAADLVRQLLTFSRRRVVRFEPLDVVDVATSLERMLRRLIGDSINFQFSPSATPLWVELERGSLEQVILNLVLNARDAMPAGGTLDLELCTVDDASSGRNLRWVSITVRDTGLGMSDDVQSRLFEPFFTTKSEQGGSGLGLSVVYGIVKQAHGRIVVQSERGCGSTFQVLLPWCAAPTHPTISRTSAVAPLRTPTRTLKIALVEDEDAVRETVSDILERAGHKVNPVADGWAAVERFGNDNAIDVLVTDVSMPRKTGPQLASELRAGRPELPVLFLSGYPQDDALFAQLADERVAFLAKPFTSAQLLSAIDGLLSKTRQPASPALVGAAGPA